MSSFRILAALAAAVFLSPHSLFALQISEILPENEGGLQDADFDSPGWIEIHNDTAATVSLTGWRLTDDALNLAKWTFPSQNLAANGRLVIFASGKNRAVAGQELHTNFQLDPDGEYLALVAPDGMTKASEFNPFPKLRRNVSYAISTDAPLTTNVVSEGAVVKYFIPANNTVDGAWTTVAFNDAAWSSGSTGLGFDAAGSGPKIDIKTPTFAAVPAPAGWMGFNFTTVPESGTGPATASVTSGSLTVKLDAFGSGITLAARNRSGSANDSIANTASLNNIAEDFIFSSTSNYIAGTPKGMDITISGLLPDTAYPVTLYAYDRASGAPVRVAQWTDVASGATGTLSFNGSDGQLADDAAFLARSVTLVAQTNGSGQLVLQGRAAPSGHTASHNVFINALQIGNSSYSAFLGTNLSGSLQGNASSLYTRVSFNTATPANYSTLRLRMRYDDGFIAWLNGNVIASRNAPAGPAWNSSATADRAKADGMAQEEINVPLPNGALVAGTNVLAIQGLKQSGAADSDFLLSPVVDLLGILPAGGVWYAVPTPGAVNSTAYQGLVRDTVFSEDRKYFTGTVTTAITCPTVGAQIRYTLDGSAPTAGTGTVYTAPLQFSSTTILRAAAFVPGWVPSNPDTQSYLSMAAIAAQPAAPAGWPATWGTDNEVPSPGTVPANYTMDPRVVNNTQPGYSITDALQAIPTISIAMNPADFLGGNGIYQNPRSVGTQWERDCSVELIDPSGAESGFHETCRIEIHGNSSRRPFRMQKHSMRLSFKGDTGAAKLRYKFFKDSKLDEFNKIILRATFTDGWGLVSWDPARYRPDDSVMMRDVWMRRSWREIGNLSPHSRYVHVVINGLYWGVFDAAEHIDEDFVAAHMGGLPADWDVVRDFAPPAVSAWNTMFDTAAGGLSTPTAYAAIQQWLDPANFADYYLLHQFGECEDWPHHNGGAWRNKLNGKYKWLAWDQEIALDNHSIDRISNGAANTGTPRTPGPLWQALKANAEFRLLVADRAHYLLNNGGPLSVTEAAGRWSDIAAQLDKPIVAESARWGDTAVETPYGNTESRPGVPLKDPYLRAADWVPNVNLVRDTWIPSLHNRANNYALITRLKAQSPPLWPNTEPPALSKHGGIVMPGFSLSVTAPAGAIYYTLNGTDPRVPVSGNAAGTLYSGPLTLTQTGTLKARAVTGTPGSGTEVWSALTQAQFIVGTAASAANLVISEVCYNPPNAEAWEYIELQNIAAGPVDLTDVQFAAGISFAFTPGTLLAAGQRLVIAADAAAFTVRFPGVTLHGAYTGKLDNSGEQILLTDALGADIRRFTYNDKHPWPVAADGNGYSVTLIAPASNPDHALPENWRASVQAGGSPGAGDAASFVGNPNADSDGDGFSDLFEYAMAVPNGEVTSGVPGVRFHLRAGADDARVIVETTANLAAWTPAATETLAVSPPAAGIVTVTWTPVPG